MKTLLLIVSITFSASLLAQKGEVTYEEKINLEMDFKDQDMGGMEEMVRKMMENMPKEKTSLFFNGKEAMYTNTGGGSEGEHNHEEDGVEMMVIMDKPEMKQYVNLKDSVVIEQQTVMDKLFLIKDKPERIPWKFTSEKDSVLDYLCQKATYLSDTTEITAWYTSKIPAPFGPSGFGQLPGLILKLDIGGRVTYTATALKLGEVQEGMIVAPKKGKKVTPEQFKKIQDEKRKEMEELHGGDGSGFSIKIETD